VTTVEWSAPHEVHVRFADLDPLGHVNNANYLTLLEDGRDSWLARLGLTPDGYTLARVEIDFVREITVSGQIVLTQFRPVRIGRTSLTLAERIVDDKLEPYAASRSVVVAWDRERRQPRPLTDEERGVASTLAGVS
jgi:acyl-CoA thioester hydrolase